MSAEQAEQQRVEAEAISGLCDEIERAAKAFENGDMSSMGTLLDLSRRASDWGIYPQVCAELDSRGVGTEA